MKKSTRRTEDTEILIIRHGPVAGSDEDVSDAETGTMRTAGKRSSSSAGFNSWPHVFNLANCIVGVSVLAMPFCFQQCGILLGVVMIGMCAVLTKMTCYFLAKGALLTKKQSYEGIALNAFGGLGRRVVEMCLLFYLVASIVAFMVVIGDIGPHIVADYLELEAPTTRLRTLVMVLVMLFVIFPLSLIKDLSNFSIVSSMAMMFYAAFVVRMMIEALPVLWEGKWSVSVVWWRTEGFLTCLPIVNMAMCCQTQLFCVIDCIKDSSTRKIDTVVSNAINSCSSMYAAVGLFGYVAYYSKTLHGDVLVELESSVFTQLMKLAFMLSIAVSIPLMLFPARLALFNLVLRQSGSELPPGAIERSTFHVLTFVILVSNMMVAILIPNVEFILGLTGSLIGSFVAIIIPSLMFIQIGSRKGHPSVPAAKLCLVAGCFILLASTWATLAADRQSTVVEKPMPKDADKPAMESLERLEEQVLDSNINISAKLDDIASMAAKGDQKEAARLIVEMKEQQEEQVKLIKKQEQIVEELNKHVEQHKIDDQAKTGKSREQESERAPEKQTKNVTGEKVRVAKEAPVPPPAGVEKNQVVVPVSSSTGRSVQKAPEETVKEEEPVSEVRKMEEIQNAQPSKAFLKVEDTRENFVPDQREKQKELQHEKREKEEKVEERKENIEERPEKERNVEERPEKLDSVAGQQRIGDADERAKTPAENEEVTTKTQPVKPKIVPAVDRQEN